MKNAAAYAVAVAIFSLFVFSSAADAALNPQLKECVQRGYVSQGSQCLFPGGSMCPIEEFNNGSCGAEYMTQDYCVKEGTPVWEPEKCCPGTEAYIKPCYIGQARCVKISVLEKIYDRVFVCDSWIIIVAIVAAAVLFWFFRRGNK